MCALINKKQPHYVHYLDTALIMLKTIWKNHVKKWVQPKATKWTKIPTSPVKCQWMMRKWQQTDWGSASSNSGEGKSWPFLQPDQLCSYGVFASKALAHWSLKPASSSSTKCMDKRKRGGEGLRLVLAARLAKHPPSRKASPGNPHKFLVEFWKTSCCQGLHISAIRTAELSRP